MSIQAFIGLVWTDLWHHVWLMEKSDSGINHSVNHLWLIRLQPSSACSWYPKDILGSSSDWLVFFWALNHTVDPKSALRNVMKYQNSKSVGIYLLHERSSKAKNVSGLVNRGNQHETNSSLKKCQMNVENFVADWLTVHELENTDTAAHFHNDQHNLPGTVQINVQANKQSGWQEVKFWVIFF